MRRTQFALLFFALFFLEGCGFAEGHPGIFAFIGVFIGGLAALLIYDYWKKKRQPAEGANWRKPTTSIRKVDKPKGSDEDRLNDQLKMDSIGIPIAESVALNTRHEKFKEAVEGKQLPKEESELLTYAHNQMIRTLQFLRSDPKYPELAIPLIPFQCSGWKKVDPVVFDLFEQIGKSSLDNAQLLRDALEKQLEVTLNSVEEDFFIPSAVHLFGPVKEHLPEEVRQFVQDLETLDIF